jgi:RND superfamily putative drug exporter
LASAILIDGILIRMVLLPGVMHLLGERAWWRRRRKEDPRLSGDTAQAELVP